MKILSFSNIHFLIDSQTSEVFKVSENKEYLKKILESWNKK